MINFFLKRFSGSHYRKFLKEVRPIVVRINEIEEEYQKLSDDELRAKTDEFRARYRQRMMELLSGRVEGISEDDLSPAYEHDDYSDANNAVLEELLPEAFAAVKNGARRLCGRTVSFVGTEQVWQMVHFDVQLIGGMALHRHMIAEMQTGEGKTLVATLPLYLNALTCRNCQLVTVNEYLAQRDAEWMGNLYNFLGLSVGVLKGSHQQSPAEKREQYKQDITYGTASEFGFDYLRDNGMATRAADQVQRDHYFTIVDEVDSVLVDEARTPLIISGPSQDADSGEDFQTWKPNIDRLVKKQISFCNQLANEAKQEVEKWVAGKETESKEGEFSTLEKLYLVRLGAPKNKILLRLLERGDVRKVFDKFELEMGSDMNKERRYHVKENLFYTIEEKQRTADLTEQGREFLRPGDPKAFILPDLPTTYMEIDKNEELDAQGKEKAKTEAQKEFEQASGEIHVISKLLQAYSLHERDVDYVVQEGKVMIVDENTGRVMPGRRWSDGLHQAVEAKENVQIERETKTYATITLQNYFRLYEKLAGMTGTAETEATEFWDIYKLKVMVVPTHRPCIREDNNDVIYKTRREKYNAVVQEVVEAHKRGQPCLVGTVSVESSEVLSRMLRRQNIVHSVLNAKQHAREAEIVARAGQPGAVTIATNMAGRGTDIKLGEGVPDSGGLYVIGTERHTSRRIDRQLRGRCARQGDPGRSKFFLSLEDDLMRLYSNQGFAGKILESSFEPGEPLEHRWLNPAIERAQKTVEQHHYSTRKRLLQFDDVLNQQREVVYGLRNDAILKDEPRETIFELIHDEIDYRIDEHELGDLKTITPEGIEGFLSWANMTFPAGLTKEDLESKSPDEIRAKVLEKVEQAYAVKESVEEPEALRRLERYVIIQSIDRNWQNHLTEMEDLRQSVNLRSYGQKDPLQEYKSEAFRYFEEMMHTVRSRVCTGVFRSASNLQALQDMIAKLRQTKQVGPADPDGAPNQRAMAAAGAARAGGSGQAARPAAPPSQGRAAAPQASQPRAQGGGDIKLPKVVKKKTAIPSNIGRNDTVKIRKGDEVREMKFKKAQPLLENDGWHLVKK